MLQNSGRPPPRDGGSGPTLEQLGRRLDSNSTRRDYIRQTQGAPDRRLLRRAEGTGMSDDLTARAAAEWRAERDRAKPHDDDYGVAQRREGKQPQSRTRFALTRFADIKALDSDEDYSVKGLLPRSGLAVVWGPPKCGKSFWTFDLLMHVALGWEYRGYRVRQGPVIYICLEGGARLPQAARRLPEGQDQRRRGPALLPHHQPALASRRPARLSLPISSGRSARTSRRSSASTRSIARSQALRTATRT